MLALRGGGLRERADAGVLVRGAPDQPELERRQAGDGDEHDVGPLRQRQPSAEWSGSGRALASPSSTRLPGRCGIRARMAADGSTARIARPNQSPNAAANAPVPAPMSSTVICGAGL